MKGIIYKYTFPDGKVYIGQTRNPERRMRDHINPVTGPTNTGFWKAYQRFGTYKYEVIREIESDNIEELTRLLNGYENGYIHQYHSNNPEYGYNRTSFSTVRSESSKILKSTYNNIYNKVLQENLLLLNRAAQKIFTTKEPLTADEKFLMTQMCSEDNYWYCQLDNFDFDNLSKNRITENKEFVLEEYISYLQCQVYELSDYIASKFISENYEQIIKNEQDKHAIVQLDKEGNIIREYRSILEICQEFKIPRGDNVRNVLKGKQKTAYGYIWKYKKEMHKSE